MKFTERTLCFLFVGFIFFSSYAIPEGRTFHYHYVFAILFVTFIYLKRLFIGSAKIDKGIVLYVIFSILCLASIFWSPDPERTSSAAQRVAMIAFVLPGIWLFIRSTDNLSFFMNAFILAGVVAAVTGILLSYNTGDRSFLGMGPAPAGELYASVALVAGLKWVATGRKLTLVMGLIACLPIVMVASIRAALFVGVVAVSCAALYSARDLFKLKLGKLLPPMTILFMILAGGSFLYNYYENALTIRIDRYIDRLSLVLVEGENPEDVGGAAFRLTLIQVGLDLARENLSLFGRGLDSTYTLLEKRIGQYTYTHFNALEILIGTGIVGFIIFHMIFLRIFLLTAKIDRKNRLDRAYIISIVIGILFLSAAGRIHSSFPIWILTVLISAYLKGLASSTRIVSERRSRRLSPEGRHVPSASAA